MLFVVLIFIFFGDEWIVQRLSTERGMPCVERSYDTSTVMLGVTLLNCVEEGG